MSKYDGRAHLVHLRTRIGSPLQVQARLVDELVRRENTFGVNSKAVEEAVDFLADYEEINALAIAKELNLRPSRRRTAKLSEEDFAPAE